MIYFNVCLRICFCWPLLSSAMLPFLFFVRYFALFFVCFSCLILTFLTVVTVIKAS